MKPRDHESAGAIPPRQQQGLHRSGQVRLAREWTIKHLNWTKTTCWLVWVTLEIGYAFVSEVGWMEAVLNPDR